MVLESEKTFKEIHKLRVKLYTYVLFYYLQTLFFFTIYKHWLNIKIVKRLFYVF